MALKMFNELKMTLTLNIEEFVPRKKWCEVVGRKGYIHGGWRIEQYEKGDIEWEWKAPGKRGHWNGFSVETLKRTHAKELYKCSWVRNHFYGFPVQSSVNFYVWKICTEISISHPILITYDRFLYLLIFLLPFLSGGGLVQSCLKLHHQMELLKTHIIYIYSQELSLCHNRSALWSCGVQQKGFVEINK